MGFPGILAAAFQLALVPLHCSVACGLPCAWVALVSVHVLSHVPELCAEVCMWFLLCIGALFVLSLHVGLVCIGSSCGLAAGEYFREFVCACASGRLFHIGRSDLAFLFLFLQLHVVLRTHVRSCLQCVWVKQQVHWLHQSITCLGVPCTICACRASIGLDIRVWTAKIILRRCSVNHSFPPSLQARSLHWALFMHSTGPGGVLPSWDCCAGTACCVGWHSVHDCGDRVCLFWGCLRALGCY